MRFNTGYFELMDDSVILIDVTSWIYLLYSWSVTFHTYEIISWNYLFTIDVYLLSLSDNKPPKISRNFLSILTDFSKNHEVCINSVLFPIFIINLYSHLHIDWSSPGIKWQQFYLWHNTTVVSTISTLCLILISSSLALR